MQVNVHQEQNREIRRRSRLACDSCARSKVKCNGLCPCRRCQENEYDCHYNRHVHKRGRKRKTRRSMSYENILTPDSPTSTRLEQCQDVQTLHSVNQPDAGDITYSSPNGAPRDHACIDSRLATGTEAADRPDFELDSPVGQTWLQGRPNVPGHTTLDGHFGVRSSSACEPCIRQGEHTSLTELLPHFAGIMSPQLARQLLELYFATSEGALFHNSSPYVLTPVLRRKSVLDPVFARPTTPALLATMIWVSAQTAALPELLAPGSRESLCSKLQDVVLRLQHDRDPDQWQRFSGRLVKKASYISTRPALTEYQEAEQPSPRVDDILSLILITIVFSGGDYKRDSLMWWSKAVRLIDTLKLHELDQPDSQSGTGEEAGYNQAYDLKWHPRLEEAKEELRRTYWLAFALDRHLALSFNGYPSIFDGESHVYVPMPERIWQTCHEGSLNNRTDRQLGPPSLVTGTSFYEFFLPLMAILGDIIHVRRQRHHPRFGGLPSSDSIAMVEKLLDHYQESVDELQRQHASELGLGLPRNNSTLGHDEDVAVLQDTASTPSDILAAAPSHKQSQSRGSYRTQLVISYARFLVHVLYALLHGEWDALTMLDWLPSTNSQSQWITSPSFQKCSSHAVFASEAISKILERDPELIFMPYLFGIYLFHGSLVLLLFADRMPAVHGGPNDAVEAACETIIRAHEACIVTLNTEFQRIFKRVMRATLMVVKEQNKHGWPYEASQENTSTVRDTMIDMRKAMLRLYRWNHGGRGLAI